MNSMILIQEMVYLARLLLLQICSDNDTKYVKVMFAFNNYFGPHSCCASIHIPEMILCIFMVQTANYVIQCA